LSNDGAAAQTRTEAKRACGAQCENSAAQKKNLPAAVSLAIAPRARSLNHPPRDSGGGETMRQERAQVRSTRNRHEDCVTARTENKERAADKLRGK